MILFLLLKILLYGILGLYYYYYYYVLWHVTLFLRIFNLFVHGLKF